MARRRPSRRKPVRAFYDPYRVLISVGSTPYSEAHEWAHVDQDARQTILWRLHRRHLNTPYLGRFAMLLMETEAAGNALWTLRQCRTLRTSDVIQAIGGLESYVRALFV